MGHFWLGYNLRTASETSKTDLPASQGCKLWQGSITPLTMYALSDVGQKMPVTVTFVKMTVG